MKTIKQWLNTIPCPLTRAAALRQIDRGFSQRKSEGLAESIGNAFIWSDTKEGCSFWDDCCNAARLKKQWPTYPTFKIAPTPATQSAQILRHLKAGRKLTGLDALEKFQCFRLGARVYDLKKQGHQIASKRIKTKAGKVVAQYSLERAA